jgi:transposase
MHLHLTDEQRRELERARDRHDLAYVRERAAAIPKIGAGDSGRNVALHRLLRRRKPDTVYDWVNRYLADGLAGLIVKEGRGRKPAFSPSAEQR